MDDPYERRQRRRATTRMDILTRGLPGPKRIISQVYKYTITQILKSKTKAFSLPSEHVPCQVHNDVILVDSESILNAQRQQEGKNLIRHTIVSILY
jgi:hypothetical protein